METLSAVPAPARGLLGTATLLACFALVLGIASDARPTTWIDITAAFGYLGVGLVGALLAAQEPRNRAAWVLLAGAVGAPLLPVTFLLAAQASGAWLIVLAVIRALGGTALFGIFTLGVLLFPDGRAHGRLGRALVPITVVALAMLGLGGIDVPAGPDAPPPIGGIVGAVALPLILGGFALILPLTVLAAATATQRRRAASGDPQRALRLFEAVAWINAVAFLGCGVLSMLATLPDWFGAAADQTGIVFAIAAWIGILRYRLIDLRAVLARSLPYLVASMLVVGIAAAVAALAGTLATGWLGAGIGAAVAAVLALVLRDRLQTLANLVVYGRRLDPATEREMRLERALHDSHRLLVTARDDERRRIRRDLHDGLGPTLAGMVLGVESAERHLDDPARARAELARLHDVSQGAVQEVRRIVYALRPPVLDSLGLDGAIREQAGRLGAARIDVPSLPALPETLEIGIYLITLEAMKNAATHAGSGPFWVRLDVADRLSLEVGDEGPGLPPDYTPGIGIRSMRERAAELGGTLDIAPRRPTGTLVRAEWMLPA